jgi:signal transduction histidine kinase
MLEEIKSNIQKINGIIQRVLDLAKQSDARQMNLEVSPLLRDTLKFWSSRMTKDGIELRLSVEEGLPDILGDPIEIQQVINNLIQNAVEAMSGGGFLTITAEKGALSFDKNRPAVVIKIQDTGSGIPIDQQKNIFNPFFTTKSSGTGLGLAISHRILSRHRGILSFESTPNVGTTFFLELRPAPSPPTISTSG